MKRKSILLGLAALVILGAMAWPASRPLPVVRFERSWEAKDMIDHEYGAQVRWRSTLFRIVNDTGTPFQCDPANSRYLQLTPAGWQTMRFPPFCANMSAHPEVARRLKLATAV